MQNPTIGDLTEAVRRHNRRGLPGFGPDGLPTGGLNGDGGGQ
jgi:hypothetical protein